AFRVASAIGWTELAYTCRHLPQRGRHERCDLFPECRIGHAALATGDDEAPEALGEGDRIVGGDETARRGAKQMERFQFEKGRQMIEIISGRTNIGCRTCLGACVPA